MVHSLLKCGSVDLPNRCKGILLHSQSCIKKHLKMHYFVSSKTLNEFALSSTKRGFHCTYLCNSATMVSFHDNVKFHTVNNDGYFWDKPLQWLALLGRGPTINIGFWKVKTQMTVVSLVADYLVKGWDGNAPLPNPYLQPLYLAPIVPSCFCQW